MTRKTLLSSLAALVLAAGPACAQVAGGLPVSGPGFGHVPASLLPQTGTAGPLATAPADVKSANPARARQQIDAQAVAQNRGDAGYLGGFAHGQALAASRQPPPEVDPSLDVTLIEAPFIMNNQDSTVDMTVGNNNSSQQVASAPEQEKTLPTRALAADLSHPEVHNQTSAVNSAIGSGNTAVQRIGR